MTRRKPNLKYQAEQAIKMINNIGQSKRRMREQDEHGIHSYKQMKETLSVVMNFIEWLKAQKIKTIYDLNEQYYREYLQFKISQGCLNGHLMNIETGLKHLEKGMKKISEEMMRTPIKWTPEVRVISFTQREEPKNRSYSELEIREITNKCSRKVSFGIMLALKLGLRAKDVINLRVEHVNLESQQIIFTEVNAKGVTKGGRPIRS